MTDQKKDIGVLWSKTGAKGEYLSGTIELGGQKFKIIAFKNGYKKTEAQPDWRIFPQQERVATEQETNRGPETTQPGNMGRATAQKPSRIEYPEEEIDPSDIPF